MNQLWAPWRMGYIGSEPEPGCLFCNAAQEPARDMANHVLFRAEHAFVMLNLYPYNSGHAMVVPYMHTGDIALLPPETASGVVATAQLTVRALQQGLHPDGLNLGINQGKVAGAGIADHVHLHVVPRWDGDTNFMPVLADAKVMPELLSATAAKLRPVFSQLGAVA
jgi:ATP adenylyltransferase